ncbi:hypothetical protein ACDZ29_23280 [Peribacillus sp. RS7]|uniref:hypothetical protein n=1 Tax=Peribacillus sp. RS7 TaxID=3242679 RepID=UPI0035C1012F
MNKKLISMIIAILLMFCTLGSLGIFYIQYKKDVGVAEVNTNERYKTDESLWDESPDDVVLDAINPIKQDFSGKLIIHSVILGFIILSEIGLLVVLPNEKGNLS